MTNSQLIGPMDICVLFNVTDSPWGGGNQFLGRLNAELNRLGHRVTNAPTSRTQVVLLNAFLYGPGKHIRPNQIAQLRQKGKMTLFGSVIPEWMHDRGARQGPILLHRVDGVPELVRGKKTMADDIQLAVNRLTDHTIFQSEYCRTSFAEHCGITPASSQIIHNGVDPKVFFPDPKIVWDGGPLRLIAVSWSSNPRKGFATLAEVSRLPGVELTFAGNWCPEVDPAKVKLAGALDSLELAALMRSNHAMIHAAWNEPCSNAIVEAMACGLPVIYRDSGGNRELASKYGIPIQDDLPAVLEDMRNRYADLRSKVLRDRDRFLIRQVAEEYLSAFRYAMANHQRN